MDSSQFLEPYLICFPIFVLIFFSFPKTSLRASCEILREGWMYGWQARSCMNLYGMYRWFGVVPQVLVLPFPSSFLVIFGDLYCDFRGGVLRTCSCKILVGCHVWGPCASLVHDFAPRIPLNRTRFGGFSSCSSSWPRETISSIPLDCERFESIPLR
jgi:hypothetical protein